MSTSTDKVISLHEIRKSWHKLPIRQQSLFTITEDDIEKITNADSSVIITTDLKKIPLDLENSRILILYVSINRSTYDDYYRVSETQDNMGNHYIMRCKSYGYTINITVTIEFPWHPEHEHFSSETNLPEMETPCTSREYGEFRKKIERRDYTSKIIPSPGQELFTLAISDSNIVLEWSDKNLKFDRENIIQMLYAAIHEKDFGDLFFSIFHGKKIDLENSTYFTLKIVTFKPNQAFTASQNRQGYDVIIIINNYYLKSLSTSIPFYY